MIQHIFIRDEAAGTEASERRLNAMAAEHGWEVVCWVADQHGQSGSWDRLPRGRWLLRRGNADVPLPVSPVREPPLLVKTEDSMLGWLKPPNIFERWLMRRGWLE